MHHINGIYKERIKLNYKVSLLLLSIIDVSLILILILTLTQVVCGGLGCLGWFWVIIPLLVIFDILTVIVSYRYSKYKKEQQSAQPVETTEVETR